MIYWRWVWSMRWGRDYCRWEWWCFSMRVSMQCRWINTLRYFSRLSKKLLRSVAEVMRSGLSLVFGLAQVFLSRTNVKNAFSFSLALDRTWLCCLKTSVGKNLLTWVSPGASGAGSPSDCSRALSMADVWTFFNLILLWMMAWTRVGEKRLTISCWEGNKDVVGSDVCISVVVSVDAVELVDGVNGSFRRPSRAKDGRR